MHHTKKVSHLSRHSDPTEIISFAIMKQAIEPLNISLRKIKKESMTLS